ncbi:MAG: hypothetical protein ACO38P_06820, partial [Phycisphaerales bacterium]
MGVGASVARRASVTVAGRSAWLVEAIGLARHRWSRLGGYIRRSRATAVSPESPDARSVIADMIPAIYNV